MSATAKQIAEMVAMRKEGKSYGEISKAFGNKYPAYSRHYILKAAPDTSSISARKHRTVAQRVPLHEMQYDMDIDTTHGDGKFYGCGKVMGTTRLLDPQATEKADAFTRDHKLHCNVLTDTRPGRAIKGRDDDSVRPVNVRKAGTLLKMRRV